MKLTKVQKFWQVGRTLALLSLGTCIEREGLKWKYFLSPFGAKRLKRKARPKGARHKKTICLFGEGIK